MEYREIVKDEVCAELFAHFIRHQTVTRCWRKENGQWCVKDIAFEENWDAAGFQRRVNDFAHTLETGGLVLGAFEKRMLKGFATVETQPLGSQGQYLELHCMHVSEDMRGHGVGKALFTRAKDWARAHGAKKLYISAHSAVESQAFYRAMGCVEAEEYSAPHTQREPCDCQMECAL